MLIIGLTRYVTEYTIPSAMFVYTIIITVDPVMFNPFGNFSSLAVPCQNPIFDFPSWAKSTFAQVKGCRRAPIMDNLN